MSSNRYLSAGLIGSALFALCATGATAQSAQSARPLSIASQFNDSELQSSGPQHYIVFPAFGTPEPVLDTARRTIVGRVVTTETRTPVSNARVSVDSQPVLVRSKEDGSYVLRRLSAGQHVVDIRAIGYKPRRVIVTVPASGIVRLNMYLDPIDEL